MPTPTPFCVMTWNVENLFPPGYHLSPKKVVEEADFQAKLNYLQQVIARIQPDVLALQELGGANDDDTTSFDALAGRVVGLLPHAALSTRPDHRPAGGGIRVGFLSRQPIDATDEIFAFAPGELSSVPDWNFDPQQPTQHVIDHLSRGALQIEVQVTAERRVRFITAHIKSKLISYPDDPHDADQEPEFDPTDEDQRARGAGLALLRRTAEAVALRTHLNEIMKADNQPDVILLGDLNDEPLAATTQLLLGPEDNDVISPDKGDRFRLYNLGDQIPLQGAAKKVFLAPDKPEDRISRIYRQRGELIDHILVSRGLLGPADQIRHGQWAVKEVRSLVESIRGESISDNPLQRVGKERPDHAPVFARFEL